MRVGVLGASGYAGGELLRLLLAHGKAELAFASSRRYAGEYLFRVHPNLRGVTEMQFVGNDISKVSGGADLIFTALPHGQSMKFLPDLIKTGVKVVDLSADFRLKDPADYETWYGLKHPAPDWLDKFVYAVPELNKDEIKAASLSASPGCMAIASILALAPLFKQKEVKIDKDHVVVDAKIASSGAGGKPSLATHFSERYGVVRPYKPVGHRHSGEIEQVMSGLCGSKVTVSMSAHAINMVRGILSTCHVFYEGDVQNSGVWKMYRSLYGGQPFVRMVKDKQGPFRLPDPKVVVGSNFCDVGFEIDARGHRIVALGAIDNLLKGAAGNAVQVMNLMMGFDEREGIAAAPLHPV
ncbi:MAG: N-acetyl-gamma-glutamyl-phosphate reductase [Nitrososphaerota archaeon]|nr:N-acetyl-gamma-glutamyl-phosphate reductase [Nitrososphaerota archaeon]